MKQTHKLKIDNMSDQAESQPKSGFFNKVGKYSHLTIQILVVIGVVGLLVANRPKAETDETLDRSTVVYAQPATLDEVSAADVASTIAVNADLIIADNVVNHADSLEASVQFAPAESNFVQKPQVVSTELKTADDILEYVVKEGETVGDIARRFNVTSDTIKWENDLIGDSVGVGKKLRILPVTGVRHKVLAGETVKSIADKYSGNEEQIVAFNDLEIDGIDTKVGKYVIIPDGVKPAAPVTPTFSSQTTTTAASGNSAVSYAFGSEPLYGGNGYSFGYCTWHAANRRAQIGRPIPRNLGNAVTWASLAQSAGFSVDGNPQVGDVLWHKATYIAGGLGHVGFVENVYSDGSILVSDMNLGGWNVITNRTVPPAEISEYLFIH